MISLKQARRIICQSVCIMLYMCMLVEKKYTDLKSSLSNVGMKGIQLCTSDVPLLSQLSLEEVPDQELLLGLAERRLGTQWRFVGRYLGVSNTEIDDIKSCVSENSKEVTQLLRVWKQQCFEEATVATLVKALYRIEQLNSRFIGELWWWFSNEISRRYCT